MDNVKQVILIRKDLKMRRGKEISQGAHAAMAWLSKRYMKLYNDSHREQTGTGLSEAEKRWLEGLFTKITLQVNSLEELQEIVEKAKVNNLQVEVITDSGLTEFHGTPTITCCAIGPDYGSKIDALVSHLKLY